MNLQQILQLIDYEFRSSSILDYEKHELFSSLLNYSNKELLDNIHNYPHLVNRVLIKRNNIKIPIYLRGKVLLISNYLEGLL